MEKSNNELIAEFMGQCQLEIGKTSMGLLENESLYHKSWDWLMPVVEKIEQIQDVKDGWFVRVSISSTRCFIIGMPNVVAGWDFISGKGEEENKLQSTYKAVVEFIKWYNQQIKK